ncbi:IclR family transcriptional regulator [Paradesulfitobacterium ferrireducens]|uniref:IclR family transcriptional regulator n=1 Tax=Paradesulfitobacterium ferrireducens TaxID=2816476 RepID=UPI001A8F2FAE|nr:IclR family transcriptional regulator [Paradesulfitobacterium ferrireducens]
MNDVDTSTRNSGCIDKVVEILGCFSYEQPELGVTEIATKLEMYKSTIFRILKNMERNGLVSQNQHNLKYRLGFKLLELGNIVLSGLQIRHIALPKMRELNESTRETITLNVVENNMRVCIEKLESPEPVRNFDQSVGGRNPLYLGAAGKVLLAFLPDQQINLILKQKNLEATILGLAVTPSILREQIARIRQQGYAHFSNERSKGAASVAAPIRNHEGNVVAGISLSGPEYRFVGERLDSLIRDVISGAEDISARLGWRK